jgi:predicted metal-binding protein
MAVAFLQAPLHAASIRSNNTGGGLWSLTGTWASGTVPTSIDTVTIRSGDTVTIDITTATASTTTIAGTLSFSRISNSSFTMVRGSMTVTAGGTLDMGTEASPIPASVYAHLILARGGTAAQYGLTVSNGGNFSVRGATKTPYGFATQSITGAKTSLTISASSATGWANGDRITIGPAADGIYGPTATDERTISISGTDPLTLSWSGALTDDRALTSTTPIIVGNLTRNVLIRSSGTVVVNPNGTAAYFSNLAQYTTSFLLRYGEVAYLADDGVDINGLTFGTSARGSISSSTIRHSARGLWLNGSSGSTIAYNNLWGATAAGLYFTASPDNDIIGNQIFGSNEGISQNAVSGSDRNLILGNYSHSHTYAGLYSSQMHNTRIGENWFFNNAGTGGTPGLYIEGFSNHSVWGNRSYANSSSGLVFFNSGVTGTVLAQNEFYGNTSDGIHIQTFYSNFSTITIVGGHSYANGASGIDIKDYQGVTIADTAFGYNEAGDSQNNDLGNEIDIMVGDNNDPEQIVMRGVRVNTGGIATTGLEKSSASVVSYDENYATGTVIVRGDYTISQTTMTLDYNQRLYLSSTTPSRLMRGSGHSLTVCSTNDDNAISQLIMVQRAAGVWQVKGSSSGVMGTLSAGGGCPGTGFPAGTPQVYLALTEGGSPAENDALDFTLLSASKSALMQKKLLFGRGDPGFRGGRSKLTVAASGGLSLTGIAGAPTLIDMVAGGTYYALVSTGAFTMNYASMSNTDNTGLRLYGGGAVSIDNSVFDNMGIMTGTNTYITLTNVISTITLNYVDFKATRSTQTWGAIGAYNVRVLGSDAGVRWQFGVSTGAMSGEAYDSELGASNKIEWTDYAAPPTCGWTRNVKKDGTVHHTTIQAAVDFIRNNFPRLSGDTCVVVRDTQTYAETVQVRGMINNGYQFIIQSDPSFVSSAPLVSATSPSTAAFFVQNASVTILNISASATGSVPYGVFASSSYVTLSSVNVNGGVNIYTAGMRISSNSSVSYSSISVQDAHGIWIRGYLNSVSRSTIAANSFDPEKGLFFDAASSNTISYSMISTAVYLNYGSDYNSIIFSTITSWDLYQTVLHLDSSSNTFSQNYIQALNSAYAVYMGAGANYNRIILSSMIGSSGIMFQGASYDTVLQSYLDGFEYGVNITDSDHMTIDGCVVRSTGSYPTIFINGPTSVLNTIRNSYVFGSVPTAAGGIHVQNSADFTTISYTTITTQSPALSIHQSSFTILDNSYVQGSTGVYIAKSTGAIIAASVLIATNTTGSALWLSSGNVNLTLTTSTLRGGPQGAGLFMGISNSGLINLTSNTITSGRWGVSIATMTCGACNGNLSITSMTFSGGLTAGATAIHFTGGRFISTFTSVAFNDANIAKNVNGSPLATASTVTMRGFTGDKSGPAYESDFYGVVDWMYSGLPAGCGDGLNVSQLGGWDSLSIMGAVNALPKTLTADTCIVIRDTQTYSESVQVRGFSSAAGYQLKIMSDPSFVSSAPVVSPLTASTAAFFVQNTSVTILNISVAGANDMPYGVYDSSGYVTISSVNVASGGRIYFAGMSVSSYSAVSYSSVTVGGAYAYYTEGTLNTFSNSIALSTGIAGQTVYLNGASSNTFTLFLSSKTTGDGFRIRGGSYNTIDQSTAIANLASVVAAAIQFGGSADIGQYNRITRSYIENRAGYTIFMSSGSRFNTVELSTMINHTGVWPTVRLDSNTISNVFSDDMIINQRDAAVGPPVMHLHGAGYNTILRSTIAATGALPNANIALRIDSSSNAISQSYVYHGGGTGMYFGGAGDYNTVSLSTVVSNTTSVNGDAALIFTSGAFANHIRNSFIKTTNVGMGVHFNTTNSNTISQSTITNASDLYPAVRISGSSLPSFLIDNYIQGSTAVLVSNADGVTIGGSVLVATHTAGSAVLMEGGSSGITLTSSTFIGGPEGVGINLTEGNAGSIILTSNTITGGLWGLSIATMTCGACNGNISITSMTFPGGLTAGATAINFTGGTFTSTFTSVAFNDANIAKNVNGSPLATASTVTMRGYAGDLSGPAYENDFYGVVDWNQSLPPILDSPASGAWVSTTAPVMTWSTVTAGNHRLQLATDSAMTAIIADSTTANAYYVSNTLTHNTTYWWRVTTALEPNWSMVYSFVVDIGSPSYANAQVSTNGATGPWTALPMATYLSSTGVSVRLSVQDPDSGLLVSTGYPTGLIGHWHFDESSGTVALDASLNSLTGTTTSTWVSGGYKGGALDLGSNTSVTIDDSPLLDVSSFTISAWVYKKSLLTNWGGIMSRQSGTGSNDSWALVYNGATANDNYRLIVNGNEYTEGPSSADDLGRWVQLTATYDGPSLRLYRNGIQIATAATSGAVIAPETSNLCIGAGANASDLKCRTEYAKIIVDETRLFNVALSSTQILAQYQSDTLGAHNRGKAYNVHYSTNAGETWNFVSTNSVTLTGGNGDKTPLTLQADGLELVTSMGAGAATNRVNIVTSDMAGNVSTATYIVYVDTAPASAPAGCDTAVNVRKSGSGFYYTTIMDALNSLNKTLVNDTCVVIRDTQTYSESVQVRGFSSASSYQLKIISDPAFVSSAPVVNPPANSTAAFFVQNTSVTINAISVITTNTVPYGVYASSGYVTISSVNVDSGGMIYRAGMSIASYSAVAYSSVTVGGAYAYYTEGTLNSFSNSIALSTGNAGKTFYLNGASSNTFTLFYSSKTLGTGAHIRGGGYNNIIQSTMATFDAGGGTALQLDTTSSNTITQSFLYAPGNTGIWVSQAHYNVLSLSTMIAHNSGNNDAALQFGQSGSNYSQYNRVTSCYIQNLLGYAVFITSDSDSNEISLSAIYSNSTPAAVMIAIDATSNTISSSYIQNMGGYAVRISSGDYNVVSMSTMVNNTTARHTVLVEGHATYNIFSDDWITNQRVGSTSRVIALSTGADSNSILRSTIAAPSGTSNTVFYIGSSSNTISESYVQHGAGTTLEIKSGAHYNTVSLSTVISNTSSSADFPMQIGYYNGAGANYNAVKNSLIQNTGTGIALLIGNNSTSNTVTLSTITAAPSTHYAALYIYKAATTTLSGVYVQGSTAAYVFGSTSTVFEYSVLVATLTVGSAVWVATGNINVTLTSSTFRGGPLGAGIYMDLDNSGYVTMTSNTITGGLWGVSIATMTCGTCNGNVSITSLTFSGGLTAGATAIHFTGGSFISTFTSVAFNDANIGTDVHGLFLDSASTITMRGFAGLKSGPSYEIDFADPNGVIDWYQSLPPILDSPPSGAWVSTTAPVMTWSTATAGNHRLQLATDSAMTAIIADSTTANTYYVSTNTLTHNTTYWWRVTEALDPNWSMVYSFVVDIGSPSYSNAQVSTNPATGPWTSLPMSTYLSSTGVSVRVTVQDPDSGILVSTGYPTGLVGNWHFDESAGTVALDASSNSLTAVTTATWVSAGKKGGALFVTGERIDPPDSTILDLAGAFSLSAWVNTQGSSDYQRIIEHGGSGSSPFTEYALLISNTGKARIGIGAGSNQEFEGVTTIPLNTWVHIAGTWDGATARLYVNGVQESTRAIAGAITELNDKTTIGYRFTTVASQFFMGSIDEARIYNVALSSAEILSQYQSDTLGAHNRGKAYNVQYSTNAGTTWNFVSTNSVTLTGGNGDTTPLTLQADGLQLVASTGPGAVTNMINVAASDMAGNVSTATYVVLVDLLPPTLGSPPSGAWVSTSVPVMTWSTAAAGAHRLQLSQNYAMTSIIADSTTANAFYISTNTLTHGATYWWRAAASVGTNWSQVYSFVVDIASPSYANAQVSTNPATGPWTSLPMATYLTSTTASVRVTVQDPDSGILVSTGYPTGLVGHWHFDESSGTVALDASSNSLTAVTTAAWASGGKIGGAVSLDGGQRVTPIDSPALTATTALTLSAWINTKRTSPDQRILEYGATNGGTFLDYNINLRETNRVVRFELGGVTGEPEGVTSVPLNTWVHVAGTYDGAMARIYINGVQDVAGAASGSITHNNNRINIGYRYDGTTYNKFFNGMLDEVRVYNIALSPAEILAQYQSDTLSAHNRGRAYNVHYSTNAGATWNFVSTNSVTLTGGNGDKTPLTLQADGLELVTSTGPGAATNRVNVAVSDMAGNVSTATYTVLIDTTIAPAPAGCGVVVNVRQSGGGSHYTQIMPALNSLSKTLTADTCVVIRDTETYSESVQVRGFSSGAGYQLKIMSDPSFVSSAPVVNPPASSMAGFFVQNTSVTILNISVISTNSVPYGVFASSGYVTISSVNVDSGGNISTVGMSLSSYCAIGYSSVTVQSADGISINGVGNQITASTAASTLSTGYALRFAYASSNTIVSSYFANTAGSAVYLKRSSYNVVSQSTITNNTATSGKHSLFIEDNSGGNTFSNDIITNLIGEGLGIYTNSNYNRISLSSITTSKAGGSSGSEIIDSSYTTITQSYFINPIGYGLLLSSAAFTTIDRSTIQAGTFAALRMRHSNSTSVSILNSVLNADSASAVILEDNSNNTLVSDSKLSSRSNAAVQMNPGVSNNVITRSFVVSNTSMGIVFESGVAGNVVSQSTITGGGSGNGAIFFSLAGTNTVVDSYAAGPSAIFVGGSTGIVIGGSVLVSTKSTDEAVVTWGGIVNLSITSSTIIGPSADASLYIYQASGLITLTSITITGGNIGVKVAAMTCGQCAGNLSITSMTFSGGLTAGATAIHFVGGTFTSTFTTVAFNDPNIAVNVNGSFLDTASTITMVGYSGAKSGPAYENDVNSVVDWVTTLPAGCVAGTNVSKLGGWDFLAIQPAIDYLKLTPNLSGDTCVVIRDTQTYSESVQVRGFSSASGYQLKIISDPAFVSSAPVVNPPQASTAAFFVQNTSVTINAITVITTNTVPYGVYASSGYVTISSVNVDSGGKIYRAGMWISSGSAISYSSITVQTAYALRVTGGRNDIAFSTITNNPSSSIETIWITGSSNSISQSFISYRNTGSSGDALAVSNGVNNTISRSSITSLGPNGSAAWFGTASSNTITQSYLYTPGSGSPKAIIFSDFSDYNTVINSTVASRVTSVQITNTSSSNTITQSLLTSEAIGLWISNNAEYNTLIRSTVTTTEAGYASLYFTDGRSFTLVDSYIQANNADAVYLSNMVDTVIGGSVLVSQIDKSAIWMTGANSGLIVTSSTLKGGPNGAALAMDAGSGGSVILTSNTITGGRWGVSIATMTCGTCNGNLSITSMTFSGGLTAGATAIHFTGGSFISTFTAVAFNDTNIAVDVNGIFLNSASTITMRNYAGIKSGPAYEHDYADPNGVVDWMSAYFTMVGGASGWFWQAPSGGSIIPSGSPASWQWLPWTPGSGRQVPQGGAGAWTWGSE